MISPLFEAELRECTGWKEDLTTDFLINQLPLRDGDIRNTAMIGRTTNNNGWSVVWQDIVSIEPIVDDAIAKLLIKAIRQQRITL